MRYSTSEKKLWEEDYKNGKDVPSISKDRSVHEQTIYSHLRKSEVDLRSDAGRTKKYGCDENYFSNLNSKNKAYWFGFIAADGWIKEHQNRSNIFGLGLAPKDKEHVHKLKNDISATYPIRYYSGSNQYVLRVSSNKLCEDLKNKGIVANKTKKLKYFDEIPEDLKKHYWRGLIDGDGVVCLSKNRHDYKKAFIELYGIKSIVNNFLIFVKSFVDTLASPNQKDANVWRMGFTN